MYVYIKAYMEEEMTKYLTYCTVWTSPTTGTATCVPSLTVYTGPTILTYTRELNTLKYICNKEINIHCE